MRFFIITLHAISDSATNRVASEANKNVWINMNNFLINHLTRICIINQTTVLVFDGQDVE